jgi:hypothetical protein
VQILLTEDQDRRLETLARRLGTSKANLVREGVEFVLERKEKGTSDPLLELIGQAGRVGQKNLSQLHDAYLAARKLKKNL